MKEKNESRETERKKEKEGKKQKERKKTESKKERTYINVAVDISLFEIVQHRGLVQVSHVGHIVSHFKLWGVDLLYIILLHCSCLKKINVKVRKNI